MPSKKAKAKKKSKDLTLQIRLTEEQRAYLQMAADANELDVSTWVRQVALLAAKGSAESAAPLLIRREPMKPSEAFIAMENAAIAAEARARKRRP